MKRIIFTVLFLSLYLYSVENIPEKAKGSDPCASVTLTIGDKRLDEISKKQLALFMQIYKLTV